MGNYAALVPRPMGCASRSLQGIFLFPVRAVIDRQEKLIGVFQFLVNNFNFKYIPSHSQIPTSSAMAIQPHVRIAETEAFKKFNQ